MRTVLIILSFVLLTSCTGSKFYNKISSKEFFYSNLINSYNSEILKKYEKIAVASNHIIYLYVPDGNTPTFDFSGLIFDVDNNKYYSIENSTGWSKDWVK